METKGKKRMNWFQIIFKQIVGGCFGITSLCRHHLSQNPRTLTPDPHGAKGKTQPVQVAGVNRPGPRLAAVGGSEGIATPNVSPPSELPPTGGLARTPAPSLRWRATSTRSRGTGGTRQPEPGHVQAAGLRWGAPGGRQTRSDRLS